MNERWEMASYGFVVATKGRIEKWGVKEKRKDVKTEMRGD